jgi:DNA polymerase-3 subunit delta'
VIQRANTKPFDSRFNVFIFVDAHAMREEAQNALLKLVEEPLPHSRLIFLTANPDGILYTIRSRCQRVRFLPLKPTVVADILKNYYATGEEDARRAAALAQGSMARARDLVESFDDSDRQSAAAFVEGITRSPESWVIGSALTVARGSNRETVAHFLDDVALVFRDVMAGDRSLYINGDMEAALDKLGGRWSKSVLPEVISRIAGARTQILFANTNVDATLTELFLDISRLRSARE